MDRFQKDAYVVASLIGIGEDWFEFERSWNRCTGKNKIAYFKTNEYRAQKKQFLRFKGSPTGEEDAQAIWDALAQVIRDSNLIGLVLGTNLRDYHKVRISTKAEKTLPKDPYRNAFHTSCIRAAMP